MRLKIDYSENLLLNGNHSAKAIQRLAFEVIARRKTTPANCSTIDLPRQSKLSDLAGVLLSLGIQSI